MIKKEPYYVELSVSKSGLFGDGKYPSAIIFAHSKEEAEEILKDKLRHKLTDFKKVKVNCCWKNPKPTIKVVKEVAEILFEKTEIPLKRRERDYVYVEAYDKISEVVADAKLLNIDWGDVYYSREEEGYVVEMHPYMRMPLVVKVFKGKTHETYQEALKWVEDNSMKKNYFRKVNL